ncbi:MAG: chorismate-binding protein [Deltaproteobacteria bacterium]|nr:chorismate-binding protein [Deltaproteobacteria bacterium]
MKLSEIDQLESFALLGPKFSDGVCLLMSELAIDKLSSRNGDSLRLVFVPFETNANAAQIFKPADCKAITLEFDVPVVLPVAKLADLNYIDNISQIRQAIAAGDVYQVCYTIRAKLDGDISGASLFACMNTQNMAPFAAWVRLPNGVEFVSASPELFFSIKGRQIISQPMKGTMQPQSVNDLVASVKDRCELAMITDLIRNDLTPICEPHSVSVTCERQILKLPYAVQTVSEISGILLPQINSIDVLTALHPGGSVTGAPKQAALKMITKLESTVRGAYCGTLGIVFNKEHSVFNLLIRTASFSNGSWVYGVGSGIVYDSDASKELQEIYTKLGALTCHTPAYA